MRFLFVDRILQSSPGEWIRGIKHVTRDDYYLCHDEHGKLCFIPSLIGEALGQLAAWNVMAHNQFTQRPVAGVVSSAQLHRPAYVGETILLESFIDSLDDAAVQYHSIARVGEEEIFRIDSALGPLLPMNDFIDAETIRAQYREINRPGDWPVSLSTVPAANKLPLENLVRTPAFLFDQLILNEPGVKLVAEKRITRAASYFPDHFPLKPVLPLTVLLECKLNLAHEFVAQSGWTTQYRVQSLRKIKMSDFAYPGDVITTTVSVKNCNTEELVLSFLSTINEKRVCVLEIVMKAYAKKSIGYV